LNGGVEREPPLPRPDEPTLRAISHPVIREQFGVARDEPIFEIGADSVIAPSRMTAPTIEQRLAEARARQAGRHDPNAAAEHAAAEALEDRRLAEQIAAAHAELAAVNAEILRYEIVLAELGKRQAVATDAFLAIKDEPMARSLRRSWAVNELAAERRRRDEAELRELEFEERKSAGW